MADVLFQVDNVTKTYRTGDVEVWALRGVDLTLERGEMAVLLGPSGSGKSTLLNIMGGLDRATSGIVRCADHELTGFSERQLTQFRRDHIGFVFQFYNLLPMLTAAENVELPLLLKPLAARDRRARVEKVLDLVGLSGRGGQYPALMSGGQQQRVGIARAIVADPALLLCDEPTGDLDRKSADDVLEMLRFLNRDLGKTIVMVTHDPRAASCARRTLRLDKGQFLEERRAA